MEKNYHTRLLSTIHESDPRSWRWWYHGNDLTTAQKELVREKRVHSKIKTRQRVLCFIFDCGCVKIYLNFVEFNLGVLSFWGFIYYSLFLHNLGSVWARFIHYSLCLHSLGTVLVSFDQYTLCLHVLRSA